MKAVILAGGFGTRISEESHLKPKPMIEIGGKPILWHIMKLYSHYGVNDFIICLGYKGYVIKEYFNNYFLHMSDVTLDMKENRMTVHQQLVEPWRVTLVDTGADSMTGGRLKRVRSYLDNESFCFTYGDGVSDVPIDRLIAHHKKEGRKATITAIQPPGRYGVLKMDGSGRVNQFQEKPAAEGAWINGGFFVLEPAALDAIDGDGTAWEQEPMKRLVAEGELSAYRHEGFWQAMDTLREKNLLEEMWKKGNAPWKVWK
jgi:glucose-1-phosphate cytidylyltransferase